MKIKELENLYDFKSLKKGQQILVEWSNYFLKHHEFSKKIMLYTIYNHKEEQHEIICRLKENHYFNYHMYLGFDTPNINTSQAVKIYLVESGEL